MGRSARAVITILVTAVVVVLAEWLDRGVGDIMVRSRAGFDSTGFVWATSLATPVIAAAILGVGVLAWRSRSALVGAVYVVAGGFLVFLPTIVWQFAAEINGTPAVLPQPIAVMLSDLWTWSSGPLNAVPMISGGMFVVGILVLARALLHRPPRPARERPSEFEGDTYRDLDGETVRP